MGKTKLNAERKKGGVKEKSCSPRWRQILDGTLPGKPQPCDDTEINGDGLV